MNLTAFLRPELCWRLGPYEGRDALLDDLSKRIAEVAGDLSADDLLTVLLEREKQGATSTPDGVALPHAMLERVENTFVAAAVIDDGVDFGQAGHPPSDIVFVLVGPKDSAWDHIRLLARLARICHAPGAVDRLRQVTRDADLYDRLCAEDALHV
jgi:PTS system nitrogen regulatory IIA component